MEVVASPDLQAKLTRMAHERGTDAQALAGERFSELPTTHEWFVREVETGLAQIGRGETLTHDEVGGTP